MSAQLTHIEQFALLSQGLPPPLALELELELEELVLEELEELVLGEPLDDEVDEELGNPPLVEEALGNPPLVDDALGKPPVVEEVGKVLVPLVLVVLD